MSRDRLKLLAKIILGGGLIYYVLRSRMVDFSALEGVLFNPINLLISLGMLTGMALCCSARWYFLAKAQGLSMPYRVILSLTMIGNFFNTFMPGSVGGDLIKALYVAGEEPKRKTKAIFTVLLDRIIGMSVIIFYASFTLFIFSGWLDKHEPLRALSYSVWSFTGISILIAGVFFLSTQINNKYLNKMVEFFRGFKPTKKITEAALMYRDRPLEIIKAVFLSGGNVLLMVILWTIHGKTLGIELPASGYFFVVPLGMTVSAIPLLPGGIGVGQVAFFTLFKWAGSTNPEQGSTLCTLMQIYVILFNCVGAIFYLRFKRQPVSLRKKSDKTPLGKVAFAPSEA